MKRVFLVMVVSAMLVTLGFAQTPDASSNTGSASVNGCLGGSEGNYTVVEDGTGQLFKIASSSIDLKAHLGHDVKLTGHKATGAANSLTASEVSMISEHCAAAAAAIPAAVTPSPETVIAPDPAAAPATASAPVPDAAAPPPPAAPAAATATAPVVDPAAPAATVTPEPVTAPAAAAATAPAPSPATPPAAVETTAPATVVSPSAPAVTARVVEEATPAPRPSAHANKLAAKRAAADAAADTASAATVSPSPDKATPVAQDAATPAAAATPSPETVSPPDVPAVSPAPPVTHRTGSLALLITFVVLVIVLGTTAPLIGRWRKRKMLERDGTPNLSFTNEVGLSDVIVDEASTNEANTGRDKQQPRKIA